MVWVRFQALGVPNPIERAAEWVRSHGQATRVVLLADSVRWGLTAGEGGDPTALVALGVTQGQIDVVRRQDPDVFLHLIDGMEAGTAAAAVGSTVATLDSRVKAVSEDFEAASEPLAAGSQPDGHPDTLRLAALLQDELAPMQKGQIEDHIESCSHCTARYLAWMELVERFSTLPEPPPPLKRSYTVPALLMIASATAAVLCVGAVALFGLFANQQAVEEASWRRRPAQVRLVSNGQPLGPDGAGEGQVVSMYIDAFNAKHLAIWVPGSSDATRIVGGPVRGTGEQLAPVDFVVGPEPQKIYVLLGDREIQAAEVRAAIAGNVADDLSVAVATVH